MKTNDPLSGVFRSLHQATIVVALLAAANSAPAALNSVRVASGLSRPVFVTAPPGDPSRLFIIEQWSGNIKILDLNSHTLNPTPFLTVSGLSTGSERGLLGLAFDPNYDVNGWFYVDYTDASGNTQIRRYQRSAADPDLADAGSGLPILSIGQPQSNHNGGWLGFSSAGYLCVSTGDGGGDYDDDAGHDPSTGNGQSLNTLLGKILRIDVNGDDFPADPNKNYAIPPDNPFALGGGLPEIWAYGLRNPWRPSFDRATGDLWIADVGQATREEIDYQPAASPGRENYGWRLREGLIQTPGAVGGLEPPGAVDPIFDYPHTSAPVSGIAITGGYVYRGPIAELQGEYFFSDYGNPKLWTLMYDGVTLTGPLDRTSELVPNLGSYNQIVSFGEDAEGNLYIVDLDGDVFQVGPAPVWSGASGANNFWTTADNWGGTTPATSHELKFGALAPGGHTLSHNDLGGTPSFNGIRFLASAAAYTLDGNPISLTGAVINESANDQVLALPLELAPGGGSFNTGTKNVTIGGVISGGVELIKTGDGTLALTASNIYSGDTTISQGTLALDGGDLNDASTVSVADGATFLVLSGTPGVGKITGQGSTTVTGSNTVLMAQSIHQNSLTVGSGARVVIQPSSGSGSSDSVRPVPEPGAFILLGIFASCLLGIAVRRGVQRPDRGALPS
jgi:autotransporter-associated beta strand protein